MPRPSPSPLTTLVPVNVASLTLRQYMAVFARPPMYKPQDLVEKSGLPQPRVSELLRGIRIYPRGLALAREALGIEDVRLFEALLENSAREAAAERRAP